MACEPELAQRAHDILMQRRWSVRRCRITNRYYVSERGHPDMLGPFMDFDPFIVLDKTEQWYRENVEKAAPVQ